MDERRSVGTKGRESEMPEASSWEVFFNPSCILEKLGCLGPCGDIVDFGCGYGTFTIPAAQRGAGRVYALDIDPGMVAETARKDAEAGLANVVIEERDFVAAGCGLPDGSVSCALLFNILHIENPVDLLKEARRVVWTGGTVGIIHWRTDIPTPRGPSLDIRPTPEQCRSWGEAAGFEFVRYESLCCCPWHWGLVMKRPSFTLNDIARPIRRPCDAAPSPAQ